jgi:hypothetical protein
MTRTSQLALAAVAALGAFLINDNMSLTLSTAAAQDANGYVGGGYYGNPGYGASAGPAYDTSGGDAYILHGQYMSEDDAVAYCAQNFRSYDPDSRTFLAYSGERVSCPQ